MTSALCLTDVSKRYSRRGPTVLRDVDLAARPGAVIHVKGANGGGKSTLLRIIAGVSSPSAGKVSGRPATVGFVPERFPATVRFTPRGYLHHLAAIRGTRPDQALELLAALGGSGWADEPMTELSKGSCQKVALAQALTGPPGLLVLDEAWTGLDGEAQTVLTAEVQRQAEAGAVVILTDHVQRATAVRPTASWFVAGGSVSEVTPTDHDVGPRVLIVLTGGFGADELSRRPGVVSSSVAGTSLRLEVDAGDSDQLLVEALRAGWSVCSVQPAASR